MRSPAFDVYIWYATRSSVYALPQKKILRVFNFTLDKGQSSPARHTCVCVCIRIGDKVSRKKDRDLFTAMHLWRMKNYCVSFHQKKKLFKYWRYVRYVKRFLEFEPTSTALFYGSIASLPEIRGCWPCSLLTMISRDPSKHHYFCLYLLRR